MATIQIQLDFDNMNVSAQVGDIVYYTIPNPPIGGFDNSALPNTKKLGPIVQILNNSIVVTYNDAITTAPPDGSFISFVKDKKVNTSSLLGYYAQIDFENDSKGKIELFSVGSEISESSK